ncbi:MAG: GAF domain-containing protein [Cyanobacteria bacterium P01_F01_bin.53]
MAIPFDPAIHLNRDESEFKQFRSIVQRLNEKVQRDHVVQSTTQDLRNSLEVDRVVLYYFYKEWEGQVTFEALSDDKYSIAGSTGPDQCFNGEYAALYLDGRVSAIANIETAEIAPCHHDFLHHIHVQANLVAPTLVEKDGSEPPEKERPEKEHPEKKLWGLLVAHHCQAPREWSAADISQMKAGASRLATASALQR